jgi:hypothetical protein
MANTPLTRCSLQPTPSRAHCRYQCCKLVHNGPNVERFIVGRQFLLLFIVFIVSRIGGAGVMPQDNFYIGNWEWSAEATQVFWNNSVLLMAVIIVPGHLVSQLMAAGKMLDFLELPYVLPFFICHDGITPVSPLFCNAPASTPSALVCHCADACSQHNADPPLPLCVRCLGTPRTGRS